MSGVKDDPGFASRWSRLKQEAKEPVADLGLEPEPEPEAQAESLDDRTDGEVLETLGLPDPETLKPGDNFAAFMAKAVPARIRNRALRKLWVSDPVFANLDLLIDYGDDFTDAATVVENLQTAYQVGKGFVDQAAELTEEEATEKKAAEKKTDEETAEQAGDPADEPVSEPGELAEAEEAGERTDVWGDLGADPARASEPDLRGGAAMPEPQTLARRRMRFRVAEE